jgi:hypothetical protein
MVQMTLNQIVPLLPLTKAKKFQKFLVCLKRLDTILITKSFVKLDSKMF